MTPITDTAEAAPRTVRKPATFRVSAQDLKALAVRSDAAGARRAFGERRTADVAEAEEEDRGSRNFSVIAHIAYPPRKVEPTFNLRLFPALLAMNHNDRGSGRGLPDG